MKRLVIISLFILLVTSTAASAQYHGYIGAFGDSSGTDCGIEGVDVYVVHFLHFGHYGAMASQFMLNVYNTGWTHIGDDWNFPSYGTSVTGVAISYGGCQPAPTYLGKAIFLGSSTPCTDIWIDPDPNEYTYNSVLAADCDTNIVFPTGLTSPVNCGTCGNSPPYNLLPADGTVGISLTPTLAWDWDPPTACREGIGMTVYSVYLGTHPDSFSLVGGFVTDGYTTHHELAVGPLQPGTVYYWRVWVKDEWWDCPGWKESLSVIQSFTTEGSTPNEPTTWGRIKSLYR